MHLPSELTNTITTIHGTAGATWLTHVDELVAELEQAWSMRLVRPMDGLRIHLVALVELDDGTEAVLKMGPPHPQLMIEAQCLQGWTDGAVKVLRADAERNAFLMEKLAPASTLSALVRHANDDEATRVIGATMLRLRDSLVDGFDPGPFEHVSSLFRKLDLLKGHLDPHLLSKAKSLSLDLAQPAETDTLLHGDLHHDNIVRHGDDWIAIDPQGYIGDLAYEVATMMHNPIDCMAALEPIDRTLDRRFHILAEALPFDIDTMRAWTFCHCVLSLAWNIDDNQLLAPHVLRVAEGLDRYT